MQALVGADPLSARLCLISCPITGGYGIRPYIYIKNPRSGWSGDRSHSINLLNYSRVAKCLMVRHI